MHDLIKVAIRNVGRNRRRSLITMVTVFLGVVVSTATRGLLNGLQAEIKSGLTEKMHGDLQIHRRGYQDSLESNPYKFLIPEQANTPWPTAPRLRVTGLLNHQKSQTTTPVVLTGIHSAKEAMVCPRFASAVQVGVMLDSSKEPTGNQTATSDEELLEATGLDSAAPVMPRSAPKSEEYQQILLTPSLARGLGAEIGDEIIVLIPDRDNMQQAIVAHLTGIVDVATPGAATRMAWMDFSSLQKRLGVVGLASEIAVRIPKNKDLDTAQMELVQAVGNEQIVETWKDLGGLMRDAMALQDVIFTSIVGIMFAIVIAAIINTSLMTVMERTREIGTLMALGYRRRHILLLFLIEAGMIGGGGGLAGIAVGSGIVMLLSLTGLTITLPGQAIPVVLFPSISFGFLALLFALSVGAALLAAFAPAHRASHLKPVEALSSI